MYRSILIAAAAFFALTHADGHAFWQTARPETLAAAPALPQPGLKAAEDFWNDPGLGDNTQEGAPAARMPGSPNDQASERKSLDCSLGQGCAP